MRRRFAVALAGGLLGGALALAGPATFPAATAVAAATATGVPPDAGWEQEVLGPCADLFGEPLPVIAGVPGVTDGGADVSLDLLVLVDDVDRLGGTARVAAVLDAAGAPYREWGITLRLTEIRTFTRAPVPLPPSAGLASVRDFNGGTRPGIYVDDLFAWARHEVDGRRPAGVDAVVVLTGKELFARPSGADDGMTLFGQADCIGGIAEPTRAFAVAEGWADTYLTTPPQPAAAATVLAHELAHLLGAHHHYGECATGARAAVVSPGEVPDPASVRPCTLLFPMPGVNARVLSTVNGAVVRGHAVRFASP